MQHDNARKFILDILDDPKNHQKYAARYVLTKSICDPCIDMLPRLEGIQHPSFFRCLMGSLYQLPTLIPRLSVLAHFELEMCPGACLVDHAPILCYLFSICILASECSPVKIVDKMPQK
jgi:hypothetical protein